MTNEMNPTELYEAQRTEIHNAFMASIEEIARSLGERGIEGESGHLDTVFDVGPGIKALVQTWYDGTEMWAEMDWDTGQATGHGYMYWREVWVEFYDTDGELLDGDTKDLEDAMMRELNDCWDYAD